MYDPKDLPFAWMQELQLIKLSTKKNLAKQHWLDLDIVMLLELLRDELSELAIEIEGTGTAEQIIDECVDVANIATMIAHLTRENAEHPPRPGGHRLRGINGG